MSGTTGGKAALRIAFVALASPHDPSAWSGTPWYTLREMTRRFNDVHVIDTPALDRVIERLASLQRLGLSVRQRHVVARLYRRIVEKQLEELQPDVVLSIGASHKLIRIDPKWPIVHVSDGLFTTMVSYYRKYGRYRRGVLLAGHDDAQAFLDRTQMTLFASDWAYASALQHQKMDPHHARVIPFGANLDADPGYVPVRTDGPLTLLFVGYDWQRKGGDIVLATWRLLRRRYPDAHLHIVGCNPAIARGLDGVTIHGRLRKSDPAEFARLKDLYRQASLFFMPSREEAFGMVLCEAAAFGVPSVSTITGGIPTAVIDGETGILLPLTATPADYAARIAAVWDDPDRLLVWSAAARRRFEERLSWSAWGEGVQAVLEERFASTSAAADIRGQLRLLDMRRDESRNLFTSRSELPISVQTK